MNINIMIKKIRQGDKSTLAKAISLVENETNSSIKLLAALYSYLGGAYRIGITGPPGVGKSTLVDGLARLIRQKNQTVGIIAVDPTSIFTGGAILGDRIRMQNIGIDNGVFIRSMATRGGRGGLARTTSQVADLLDSSGKNYVIIETVGIGQAEVEIFKNVDTTILILSPESGDTIQAMKAGIMEIADIIVVNKADRPGADALVDSIRNILELSSSTKKLPILKTEAVNGHGLDLLLDHLENLFKHLKTSGELEAKRSRMLLDRLRSLVINKLEQELWKSKKINTILENSLEKLKLGKETPYHIAEQIVKSLIRSKMK